MTDRQLNKVLASGVLSIAIVIALLFVSWFCLLVKPVSLVRESKTTMYVKDSCKFFPIVRSDLIADYYNQTDDLNRRVGQLEKDYNDNVDLMINKANGWLAFWIGIIAIALGMISLWYVFRQLKIEGRFDKLEKDFKKKTEQQQKDFNAEIDKLKKEKEQLMCYVHENKISSSMASISIVDPLISASPSERKKHIKLLLKEILEEYDSYLKQAKEMDSYKVTRHDMAFVLVGQSVNGESWHRSKQFF